MRKRERLFIHFFIFLFLSLLLFFLGRAGVLNPVRRGLEVVVSPLEHVYGFSGIVNWLRFDEEAEKLKEENRNLAKKLIDQTELQKENQALKDQFETGYPASTNLLPAKIIGIADFIPGVTAIESITLNKGTDHHIKKGMAVIVKNFLVGRVTNVSFKRSRADLVTHKNSKVLGKISAQTEGVGVVKGVGNGEMVLENVVLSTVLAPGDTIVSVGDATDGGIPEGLIIGKVVSIDKKSSSLFQTGKLKNAFDISELTTVFIVVE